MCFFLSSYKARFFIIMMLVLILIFHVLKEKERSVRNIGNLSCVFDFGVLISRV